MTILKCEKSLLRSWTMADAPSLAMYANNRRIWRNMHDAFPYPYTLEHAREWIGANLTGSGDAIALAIEVGGEAAGSIACRLHRDGESTTGNVGYWLGEGFWGKGIVTDALKQFSEYLFDNRGLRRIEACVYAWNPASGRVLRKAGFHLEGRLEGALCKDGEVTDKLIYGKVNPALEPNRPVSIVMAALSMPGFAP